TAMLRSAERSGFVREGVLRSSAWVMGEFLDEPASDTPTPTWPRRSPAR
ncbi:N-acetyltransferase, partial [Streptomyces sp. NPDC005476]